MGQLPLFRTLSEELHRLPGIGPKMAERLALHLLRQPDSVIEQLFNLIRQARQRITFCERCFALSETRLCSVCQDNGRQHKQVCVVERPQDIFLLEKAGNYQGVYHVLHGVLSPLEGVGPSDLKIAQLVSRVKEEKVEEIIIATDPDVEGDTTATFLAQLFRNDKILLTRLGQGLPVGISVEQADEVTLAYALEGRQKI